MIRGPVGRSDDWVAAALVEGPRGSNRGEAWRRVRAALGEVTFGGIALRSLFELRTLDMRKLLVAVAVWYFILAPNEAGPVQVGPFATQAACDNFRMGLSSEFEVPTSACFSTTAKQ